MEKVKRYIRKGIPPELRGQVWVTFFSQIERLIVKLPLGLATLQWSQSKNGN